MAVNLPPGLTFRPNTWDADIFRSVWEHNEYRLPEQFAPGAIVLDIGAHVGGFAAAALHRGAAEVWCYEPDPENFRLLTGNLRALTGTFTGAAVCCPAALWRSDRPAPTAHTVPFGRPVCPQNTGGGGPFAPEPALQVRAMPFDAAVQRASHAGRRRIALVKLDCEGAEFPILLTSSRRTLDMIDTLCGEYHLVPVIPDHARVDGVAEFTPEILADCLTRHGFTVDLQPAADGQGLGLFWARRPAAEAAPAPLAPCHARPPAV